LQPDQLDALDAVVFVLSSPERSQNLERDIEYSEAYSDGVNELLVALLILPGAWSPDILRDNVEVIELDSANVEQACSAINSALVKFELGRTGRRVEREEIQKAVQVNLASFVQVAIDSQKSYESQHRTSARIWYGIGFVALFLSFTTTFILAYNLTVAGGGSSVQSDWSRTLSLALLNVVGIAILAAIARYCYSLGKSYMSESLKSSDRIHAIRFGEFFLNIFGSKASTEDIKDAFQHWNIDRNSTFSTLDSAQIDPQVLSAAVQIISSVTGKKG
jgi:hypothetical protein